MAGQCGLSVFLTLFAISESTQRKSLRLWKVDIIIDDQNGNTFVESFNGKFKHLIEARDIIAQWRLDYNYPRLNHALGQLTPMECKNLPQLVS
ncbi:integrase core domain-containing protein [Alteromonas sp. ASW11-130]|uniref:integrase core domain-containing protein n=1 Tax=Alteromonas sp. ASW11-130 TaxID=3015775 RepID=UPI0022427ADE|nr:integrase core domain-containing protein [Alteromonas sp. ASW11-130]MCW8092586.1 transposase [Alteromonas sp. ASW11-130]